MLWALFGQILSTPAVLRLFELTAQPDRQNQKSFAFKQASLLAEHILRMVSHYTPDKVGPLRDSATAFAMCTVSQRLAQALTVVLLALCWASFALPTRERSISLHAIAVVCYTSEK